MRIGTLAVLFGLAAALDPESSHAHEFWVEPSTFAVERGGRVGIRLCVGDGFEGWSLARNTQRIARFFAAGPSGDLAIVGLDGSDPAGVARFAAPGTYVIVYRSNRAITELSPFEFDEYLREKGLEKIAEGRQERGASSRKVREAYSRHSKSLIRVGDADANVIDRPMNLRLELVAEPDLFREQPDDMRFFRLLYGGKPLPGALVTAARPGTADEELRVRTDADGRAGFKLHAPGMWRIAAVHMIEPPGSIRVDWESLWTSLTFELPSRMSPIAGPAQAARSAACRNKIMPATGQARS